MATRRMLSREITDSDFFLDMSLQAQALYMHLNQRADDDGFVSGVKSILRQIGAKDRHLMELIDRKFILQFESGVICIKGWFVNNYIRQDRYKETNFKEEKALLKIDENGSYSLTHGKRSTNGQPNVNQRSTQDRIGKSKDRIGYINTPVYDPTNNPHIDEQRLDELMKERRC